MSTQDVAKGGAVHGSRQLTIGYLCVSNEKDDVTAQERALVGAGCAVVFREVLTRAGEKRPQLTQALVELAPGSTFLTWSIAGLRLRAGEIAELVSSLERQQIRFQTLREGFDTSSSRVLVAFCAEIIRNEPAGFGSRVRAGMAAADARGVRLGRPVAISDENIGAIKALMSEGMSTRRIAARLGLAKSTTERYVSRVRRGLL